MTKIQQFRNIMKANNFKTKPEIIKAGVTIPAGMFIAMSITSDRGENSFARKTTDEKGTHYDFIYPSLQDGYYCWHTQNEKQERYSDGEYLSLEELSARVNLNMSQSVNKPEEKNSIPRNTNSSKINESKPKAIKEVKKTPEVEEKTETKPSNLFFADIGGQKEAISKMKKTILYPIKYPEAFAKRKISHGVVLYGPPGTGKSLIAEALANESNAHYIKLNGLEMISKWVGQSEENLRKLFAEAKEKQPSIIFIDEFDGIAAKRDNERDPHGAKVVNQILTLISDIEKNGDNIFVVTATNRLDLLDSAVTRSGRFETHIELLPPRTELDVLQILDIHAKKLNLDEDLNKPAIAEVLLKNKATGADIASIVNAASEHAFSQQDSDEDESIYDKMENGTFKMSDLENVKIKNSDFEAALREKYGRNISIKTFSIPSEI